MSRWQKDRGQVLVLGPQDTQEAPVAEGDRSVIQP